MNIFHIMNIPIGYPLWWGEAPNIIHAFMKKYDFSNKNIITFCTSSSTSTDSSRNSLPQLAPNAKFNENWHRFSSSASTTVVRNWIDTLGLTPRILIVYFSAQGHTRKVAEIIKNTKIADLKEIVPKQIYTNDDLNWHNEDSRVWEEHRNPDLRPEYNDIGSLDQYDTIFIGYPLWWRRAPHVVYTFVENNDFSGKTIIPFCTSTSDPIGDSGTDLESKTKGATWQAGQRFSENPNEDSVRNWANSITFDDDNDDDGDQDQDQSDKILVIYFSATGNTRRIAQRIRKYMDKGRIVEITPVDAYTSRDLNYGDSSSRVVREHEDPSLRPAIHDIQNVDKAETIFIGYPLWWIEAPHVVYTFIEKYNFNGKTLIPFCTSTSDNIGKSGKNLAEKTNGAKWFKGQRFSSDANENKVNDWMKKVVEVDSNGRITFKDKTLSNGLSTGVIIGIVAACVVAVAIIIVVVVIVVRKKRSKANNNSNSELN